MALSQNIGDQLAGGPTSAETAIADADRAYALRPELEGIEASIKALAPFVESDPGAAWRIGRACFFLGEQRNARSHKRKYFKHGARVCGIAGSGWPGRAEPIFWGGVNLGLLAEGSRFPLSLAYAIRAARLLNRAADLDPGFHGAGPLRVLARLKHKMPRVAGGSADRARVLYERAIALWPANTVTRIYFAELLVETGNKGESQRHLDAVLNGAGPAGWEYETARDKKIALRMIEALDSVRAGSSPHRRAK